MKQRDYRIDTIKGIMIFLVVLGHCIGQISTISIETTWIKYFIRFIFSFHMPVFVFISGYFSSTENRKTAISRYLIPYVLINALFGLSSSIINSQFSFSSADPFSPQWTFWYLLSLFFWKVFLSSVLEWKKPLLMMILLGLITGIFSADYYLSLSRTVAFFPYFIAGYLVRKNDWQNKWKNHINKKNAILIFAIIELIVAFLAFRNVNGLTYQLCRSYRTMNQSVPMGMLLRLFTYIAGAAGILFFFSVISNKKNCLSDIGRYSLTVYLAHSFCIKFAAKFIQVGSPALVFLISIIISAIICTAFGNQKVSDAYHFIISKITRLFVNEN